MPDGEKSRWYVWLVVGLAVGAVLVWFLKPQPPPETVIQQVAQGNSGVQQPSADDFRGRLAALLNLHNNQTDRFFLNLPPRPNCYPGAIISLERDLPFLEEGDEKDANLKRGKKFTGELRAKIGSDKGAGLVTSLVRGTVGNKAEAEVEVVVKDVQVIEIKNTNTLKEHVATSSKVRGLDAKGIYPLVIFRAYEGLITFNVTVKNAKKGDLEAKPKQFELKGEVNKEGKGNLTIKSDEPTVFAFLAVTTDFVQKDLAGQKLQFVPVHPLKLSPWDLAEAKSSAVAEELNKK